MSFLGYVFSGVANILDYSSASHDSKVVIDILYNLFK